MRRVYCDANATTPLLPEVMEAMRPYWMEHFGNASSIHLQGQRARKAVDGARETLATFFHCREAEVVFNSGGTEGDNTAIFGLVRAGDHLITTAIEHSAVLRAAERVAERGADVTFVAPREDGLIDPEEIRQAVRPQTRLGHSRRTLISVMLANNETGVLQPVEEIGKIAAEAGASFISMRCRARERSRSTCGDSAAICARSARTRCTGRRAWARCMCGAERRWSR